MITATDLRNLIMTGSMIEEKYLNEYLETQALRFNDKVVKTLCQRVGLDSLNEKVKNNERFKNW